MNYNFNTNPKKASEHTKEANNELRKYLDFTDTEDFELSQKGLLFKKPRLVIKGESTDIPAWDLESYSFINGRCPETVNPSLWRIAQLNMTHGLFQVVPGVYQVRGYDIAYTTFIQGNTGWICVDPLTSVETARAAKALVDEHFGPQRISAVLYTHGHKDHYAGVKGMITEEDVAKGVKIYAPEGFLESAVSENVYAGQAMGRRSMYVYGSFLPRSPEGNVGNGIGMTSPLGISSMIAPTNTISEDKTAAIDGIDFEFILAPETEAPAEFLFYLPKHKALFPAEITNAALHNIYTIRGAEIRDAKVWAAAIDRLIQKYAGKAEVIFMSHHWPRWGKKKCREYLENQRDIYKFLHDQTLNLANQGYTPDEIGEMIKPPKELDAKWYNRGYHGTLSHNARGIYQKYIGFWDGNPSTLNKLPASKSGVMFIDMMGGREAALEKALAYFNAGEYRFVAEALNYVVFAYPDYPEARLLLADALEQLGYQAENGTWRNAYLTGAMELRHMSPSYHPEKYPDFECFNEESISGLTPEMMLDYLAIKLDTEAARDKAFRIFLSVEDEGVNFEIEVRNSVLNYRRTDKAREECASLTISRFQLGRLALSAPNCTVHDVECKAHGDCDEINAFLGIFKKFPFWFNIIEA